MHALVRLLLAGVVCLSSGGCITALTAITLRPDGSGTIEQTMSMKAEMAKQLAGMMQGMADESAESVGPPELFSEQEMREGAAKYGEGVAFVSSRPIDTAGRVGRVATYSFRDITTLRVNQKPAATSPAGGMGEAAAVEDLLFRFSRQPAGTSLVTVVFPEAKLEEAREEAMDGGPDASPDGAAPSPDPAQLAMMKQLFDGLRIAIDLEVDGDIVTTNSPFVSGSRVTLLEMDFSELMKNEALLGKVSQPKSIEEAKLLLQGIKGFKVNLDPEVTVEFK